MALGRLPVPPLTRLLTQQKPYHSHALLNCFGEDLHCSLKDNKLFRYYIVCTHRAPFTAVCLFILQFAYMRF